MLNAGMSESVYKESAMAQTKGGHEWLHHVGLLGQNHALLYGVSAIHRSEEDKARRNILAHLSLSAATKYHSPDETRTRGAAPCPILERQECGLERQHTGWQEPHPSAPLKGSISCCETRNRMGKFRR